MTRKVIITIVKSGKVTSHTISGFALKLLPLGALALGFIVLDWGRLSLKRLKINEIKQKLTKKEKYIAELETKLYVLKNEVDRIKTAQDKMRILIGLKPKFAIGGTGEGVSEIKAGLEEIIEEFSKKEKYLASLPTIVPMDGYITSEFGPRIDPLTGKRHFHTGIDIASEPGTPVKATGGGEVTKVGFEARGMGIYVIIKHNSEMETLYGHLSRAVVKKGQKIKRGDIIGFVGNTGRSTGYHLHYEVKVNGLPVNPRNFFFDLG